MKITIECDSLGEYMDFVAFVKGQKAVSVADTKMGVGPTHIPPAPKENELGFKKPEPPKPESKADTKPEPVPEIPEETPKEAPKVAESEAKSDAGTSTPSASLTPPKALDEINPWVKTLTHGQLLALVEKYPDIKASGAILLEQYHKLLRSKVSNYFEAILKTV